MDATEIAALLAKDREQWGALKGALDARPDEVLHDPESPEWTARDVYAHLARWMGRSMDQLEVVLADGERLAPIPGTDDEINARWQAEDAGLTLEQARERAEAAFDRRIATLEGIAVERWDLEVQAHALADGWEHIGAHHRYIEG